MTTGTIADLQPGLRERKKRATREAIKQAALRLALENGVERLTVEQISAAADVSPRTFFNYFGCKEDALVDENVDFAAELHELVVARPAGEPPLASLRAAFLASEPLRAAPAHREQARARRRLVRENPGLLPRQIAKYDAVERLLVDALAVRLGVDPDEDHRPAVLAAVAVTVLRVAFARWTGESSGELIESIEEAFDLLAGGRAPHAQTDEEKT